MNLYDQAALDNADILQQDGIEIKVQKTSNNNTFFINALVSYIGFSIDPGTGQAVAGSQASCSINPDTLESTGLNLNDFVTESGINNLVLTIPFRGKNYEMKILEPIYDRQLQLVLLLELIA